MRRAATLLTRAFAPRTPPEQAGSDRAEALSLLRAIISTEESLPDALRLLDEALIASVAHSLPVDLDEVVDVRRRHAARDPAMPAHVHADAYRVRFEATRDLADLDAAIAIDDRALAARSGDPALGPPLLLHLSELLRMRSEATGSGDDLARAVTLARRAVATGPEDHPLRAATMAQLATVLRVHSERTGLAGGLDEAVAAARAAARLNPGHAVLAALTDVLRVRFQWTGVGADLDEAVAAGRRAVLATPPGHPYLASYLTQLAGALVARGAPTRPDAARYLDEAVAAARAAAGARAPGHIDRSRLLTNLSTTRSPSPAAAYGSSHYLASPPPKRRSR